MNKRELIEHISSTLDKYLKNTTFVKPVLTITEIAKSDEVSLEFEVNKNCILLDDVSYRLGYDEGRLDGEYVGQQLKDADKIRQELNKPVVKQFVADWYKEHKDDFEGNLFRLINRIPAMYQEGEFSEFEEWIIDSKTEPFQTLVNMHQFGYEVEEEKRYRVRIKGVFFNSCLIFDKINKKWFFSSIYEIDHQIGNHTRKELEEAGFEEVFNSPLFEVEEVEG